MKISDKYWQYYEEWWKDNHEKLFGTPTEETGFFVAEKNATAHCFEYFMKEWYIPCLTECDILTQDNLELRAEIEELRNKANSHD